MSHDPVQCKVPGPRQPEKKEVADRPDTAWKVKRLVGEYAVRRLELSREIERNKKAVAEIARLDEECRQLKRRVLEGMELLDVKHSGNYGWEQRIMNFLAVVYDAGPGEDER